MGVVTYASWCADRDAAAFGPHGLASLAATIWLDSSPADVVGEASLGPVEVRRFERDGRVAVRIYDPARAAREGMRGIERFPYEPSLVIAGRVEAAPREPVPTLAVDGHRSTTVYDAAVRLTLAGEELTLLAHRDGDQLFAVFADATAGDDYAFRMIRVDSPDASGHVTLDLNRAYLPPSRFSPHYVCVTPPPANRWRVPVRAGERRIVRA